MNKRLYRSETDLVLGGVCGGLGEYLRINPLFIRIFFVVWTILGELSVLIYIILWLVVPRKSDTSAFRAENLGARFRQIGWDIGRIAQEPSSQLITYAGVGLIGWGVFYLLRQFGFPWIDWDYTRYVWPVFLIVAGVFVLLRAVAKKK